MKKPSDFIYGIIATVLAGLLLFILKASFYPDRWLTYDINYIEDSLRGIYLNIVLNNKGATPEENVTLKLNKRTRTELKERTQKIEGSSVEIKTFEITPIEEGLYYESSSETISVKAVEDYYIINFGTLLPKQEATLKGFFVGASISGYSILDDLNIKSSKTKAEISYFSYVQLLYPFGFWLFGGIFFLIVVGLIYEFNFTSHEKRVKDAKKAYEDLLDKKDIKGNEKHNI